MRRRAHTNGVVSFGLMLITAVFASESAAQNPPSADAGGPYSGNVGEPILFDGTGSSDPDGDPLDYLWNFGDGGISNDPTPTHTYDSSGAFSVTLTVTDPLLLTDADLTSAQVNGVPNAKANGPYSGNVGEPIDFSSAGSSDPEGETLTYLWDFGDGGTSANANPSHMYTSGGIFTVTLTVTDPGGSSDSEQTTADINRPPTAEANGPYAGNQGQSIHFSSAGSSDPDGDPLTYLWDFGDGGTSTGRNPNHTYTSGGTFILTLVVTDPDDLSDSEQTSTDVNRPPTADANGPYSANVGEPIAFSSAGSSDPDGDSITYQWNFGDGNTSTAANPSHTYASGGNHPVTLIVTDPDDSSDSDQTSADANGPPTAQANGPYAGNQGQPIAFSSAGSTDPDGDTLTYLWDFGDAATSTAANPSHTYTSGGTFTVTLTVTDPGDLSDNDQTSADVNRPPAATANGPYSGNDGEPIVFSSAGSGDPDGDSITYLWNFGDGNSSTAAAPTHTYASGGSYPVSLTVTDPGGLDDEDITSASISGAPTANANGPYAGNVGQPIAFSSAGSGDPDGDPITYQWNFGDGGTSTAANPSHTYVSGGTFTVTLTVRDPGDLTDSDQTTADINRPPTANANGPYAGNIGAPIAFSSAGSSDPDGDTLTYLWNFGDGNSSTAPNPSHTYASGGTFTVTLTVRDPGNLTGSDQTSADVNRPPSANANGPYSGSGGEPIAFSSAGSGDPDGDTLTYLWDFGDGGTSTAANPSHTYATGGIYPITLTVTDPGGLDGQDTSTASISGAPTANANGPYAGNVSQPIAFSSAGSGDPDGDPITYQWNFGDGGTSTAANPSHTYVSGGTFTVTLTVRDPGDLTGSDQTTADINRPPTANANGPYTGNVGAPIGFTSSGSSDPDGDTLTYLWDFGDGGTSTAANPSHTYTTGGTRVVTLTVTDPGGLDGEDTTSASVSSGPTADANGPYSGNQGEPIAFSSAGSSDPDGDPITYLWNFGDGGTSTAANPSHTYVSGGIFTVTLTVRDPGDLTGSDQTSANVNRPPLAEANGPYTANPGVPIAFSSAGSSDPDGDTLTYLWDFGDGGTSTAANPSHTYATGGTFTIILTVTDPGDLSDSDQTTASANQTPVAEANGPYAGDRGVAIAFSSAGSSDPEGTPLTYHWSFGDGATSTAANPSHAYAAGGDYTAVLTVTDTGGLADPDSAPVSVGDITVTAPVAGAVWSEGSRQTIRWTVEGNVPTVVIEFQTSPAAPWTLIANAPGSAGQFLWLLPDIGSADATNAAVRVQRSTGAPLLDVSDPFTIQNRVLTVTAPLPNATLFETTQTTITWTSVGAIEDVEIDYRLIPTGSWQSLANLEPNDGSFTWTLPEVSEDQPGVQVRVRDSDGPTFTTGESAEFTIANRVIQITAPAAEAVWSETSTQSIMWNVVGPIGDVRLDFRRGVGAPWEAIATVPAASGAYSWLVAAVNADADRAQIRIVETASVNEPVTDTSPAFTIQNRMIAIAAPAAGDSISERAQTPISWTSTGLINNVTIEFRRLVNDPWELVVASTPNDGEHLWTTPEVTADVSAAQVRITDVAGPPADLAQDVSEAFTLVNRALAAELPEGGEILCEADTIAVTWTSQGLIPAVHLDWRLNSSVAWTRIVSALPNDGVYVWTTPDLSATSTEVQLRVQQTDEPQIEAVWPPFTLTNRTLVLQRPAGGETFTEGDAVPVSWSSSCLDSVRLEARLGPAEPWLLQNRGVWPNVGQIIWTVIRVEQAENDVQLRLSDASDPNDVVAISQPFTVLNRILDVVRPTVTDSLSETQIFTIDWDWEGNLQRVDVDYRLDSSLPWVPILDNAINNGTHSWTVPLVNQDYRAAQIRVTDSNNPAITDDGDPFIVINRALAVLYPAATDTLTEARVATIRWETRGLVPQVTVSYRLAPVDPWQVLATAIANTGSLDWSVPELGGGVTGAQVRIAHASDPTIAVESAPFVILDRSFAVTSPAGGEEWSEATEQVIRWTAVGGIDSVTIERVDLGDISTIIFSSTPNDGEEVWAVPELAATLTGVRIRVADVQPPAAGATSAPFNLINRAITLASPAPVPHVEWRIGSTQEIRWQTTGAVDSVTVELERDPPAGEVEILTASTPNDGSFIWNVTGPETFTAALRVRHVAASHVVGETPFPLALYDLIPPERCADFDHSQGISLDEVIRLESIIVGTEPGSEADTLAADCGRCTGTVRDGLIDLCDLLRGVDEMVETERAGGGRPFADAGAVASERGAVIRMGAASEFGGGGAGAAVPVEVESRFPLAGLVVEFEVEGGSMEPVLGPDADGMELTLVPMGGGHVVAAVRRAGSGRDLGAGTSVPLAVQVRPLGKGRVQVRLLRAEAVAQNLSMLPVHLEGEAAEVAPPRLVLAQNRPNPFNPTTVVPFALPAQGRVELAVYDVAGRLVRRLIDAELPAGFHTAQWDGRDERGMAVASGIYLYALRAGGEAITRKMALLR